jgi:hypothetical protein
MAPLFAAQQIAKLQHSVSSFSLATDVLLKGGLLCCDVRWIRIPKLTSTSTRWPESFTGMPLRSHVSLPGWEETCLIAGLRPAARCVLSKVLQIQPFEQSSKGARATASNRHFFRTGTHPCKAACGGEAGVLRRIASQVVLVRKLWSGEILDPFSPCSCAASSKSDDFAAGPVTGACVSSWPELLAFPRDLVPVDEEFRSGVRRAVQDDGL